jgi:hypothetical protein
MDDNVSVGASGVAANPVTNTAAVDGTQRAFTESLLKTVLQSMFDNGADLDRSTPCCLRTSAPCSTPSWPAPPASTRPKTRR